MPYIIIAARRFPWILGSLFFALTAFGWWGYRTLARPAHVARPQSAASDTGLPTSLPTITYQSAPAAVQPPTKAVAISAAQPAAKPVWSLPILMYHYVRVVDPAKDNLGYRLSVTKEQLSTQLDYLVAHGYHTIDPQQLLKGDPLPPKSILLTFDDGYEDFYTVGWPVVRAHQMTAMQFIITGFVGRDPYLTNSQIQELERQGVVIGAHTIDHVNLATQTPERLRDELVQPKQTLETLLGKPVPTVAYPSGKFNDAVLVATKKAGYTLGFTTQFGLASNLDDPLALHRIEILGSDSMASFVQKLTGKITSSTATPVKP